MALTYPTNAPLPQQKIDVDKQLSAGPKTTTGARKRTVEDDDLERDERNERIKKKLAALHPSHQANNEMETNLSVTTANEESMQTDSKVTEIAPDGDLIVIVGSEQRRFRVHALILKMTSPIFESVTDAQRSHSAAGENQTLQVTSFEGDSDAFEALFTQLHQHKVEPFHLTPKLVQKVACLAITLGCTDRLAYASDYWLKELKYTQAWSEADSCWILTIAAHKFANADWFRAYSAHLLQLHHLSSLEFAQTHESSISIKLARKSRVIETTQ